MAFGRFFFFTLAFSVFFCATGGLSHADVFMLKDRRGIVYFSDTPPAKRSRLTIVKRYRQTRNIITRRSSSRSFYRPGRLSFPTKYDHLIRSASIRYNLDPLLIKAVIKVESDFNRYSISSKGAKGLMQLMPKTAKAMRVVSLFSPAQNINGGAKYLKRMLNKFRGNIRLALAAYNAGPTAVKQYRGVPPYPETRRYIKKVRAAYRALSNGRSDLYLYSSYGQNGRKSVVYTYKSRGGAIIYTDTPMGSRKIIAD